MGCIIFRVYLKIKFWVEKIFLDEGFKIRIIFLCLFFVVENLFCKKILVIKKEKEG